MVLWKGREIMLIIIIIIIITIIIIIIIIIIKIYITSANYMNMINCALQRLLDQMCFAKITQQIPFFFKFIRN